MMSLRWRILVSTVLVVVLTVVTSVAVGYYATQARLDSFVEQLGDDEASQLAQKLSQERTAAGGWETLDATLSEIGYLYDEAQTVEQHGEGDDESSEFFHKDRIRVVVVDIDGLVVKDNLAELLPGTAAPELDGRQETVFDLETDAPAGYVYVDVNREFLSNESHGFLSTLLYITLIGGALTIGGAVLLAAWLAKQITAPVTALTEATQAIAQGETTSLPVTSSDELGKMSSAFNRMTSALEAQRELRRRLINDVSHELNTPLSVIMLEAQGLRDGLQSSEDASDHIIEEVNRLRGLVTDLDWLAETDQGALRLTLESGSIHELLAAEVERWQPHCQARRINLSLLADDNSPTLRFDHMRMNQALGNVVSNAIHCTDDDGSIVIRAGHEGDEVVFVSIADDGIGIAAADLPHVFERFYRTDQSQRLGLNGTGLGLAITRAIVEAHGGTIGIASEGPGRGTTVTIRIPLGDLASQDERLNYAAGTGAV